MLDGKFEEALSFLKSKKELFYKENRIINYHQLICINLLKLGKVQEFNNVYNKLINSKNVNDKHHSRYVAAMKLFNGKDYFKTIEMLDDIVESDIFFPRNYHKDVLADLCKYWISRSYIELGEFEKAIDALNSFRPTHNGSSVQLFIDTYWPKKNYLKGIAYEGLGDKRNARESYKEFLEVWHEADDDLPEIIDAKKKLQKLGWNT